MKMSSVLLVALIILIILPISCKVQAADVAVEHIWAWPGDDGQVLPLG